MAHGGTDQYYDPSDKVVYTGDDVLANDLNSVNSDVDIALGQVADDLDTLEATVVVLATESYHWANYPEDSLVPEGNLIDEYSAYHYDRKSDASATAAASSESTAVVKATESNNWANYPEDSLVPEGNMVDDYSSYHYSQKSEDSATAAAASATIAQGQNTLSAGAYTTITTTGTGPYDFQINSHPEDFGGPLILDYGEYPQIRFISDQSVASINYPVQLFSPSSNRFEIQSRVTSDFSLHGTPLSVNVDTLTIALNSGVPVSKFSTDGTLSGNSDTTVPTEKAVKTATDSGDAATLASANTYADSGDAATLASANTYADSGDAATLASANTYADSGDAATLASANTNTNTHASVNASSTEAGHVKMSVVGTTLYLTNDGTDAV